MEWRKTRNPTTEIDNHVFLLLINFLGDLVSITYLPIVDIITISRSQQRVQAFFSLVAYLTRTAFLFQPTHNPRLCMDAFNNYHLSKNMKSNQPASQLSIRSDQIGSP